jgi:hypothetical protein
VSRWEVMTSSSLLDQLMRCTAILRYHSHVTVFVVVSFPKKRWAG